jgi:hypothetical protein
MKTTGFILALALFTSCGSQPGKTEKQTGDQDNSKEIPVDCYQYAQEGDTITLHLVHIGDLFTGVLYYKLKEKDLNVGSIKGSMTDGILVADYTFKSEGTSSTRQVAFKKVGNTFIEGYAETKDENGVTKFKNLDSLVFSSSIKLQETVCE